MVIGTSINATGTLGLCDLRSPQNYKEYELFHFYNGIGSGWEVHSKNQSHELFPRHLRKYTTCTTNCEVVSKSNLFHLMWQGRYLWTDLPFYKVKLCYIPYVNDTK